MSTVHVVLESPLTPELVLTAARDFSERREDIFPAVSVERLTVHALGDTWADVTEGTRQARSSTGNGAGTTGRRRAR